LIMLEEIDTIEVHIQVPESEMKRVQVGTQVVLRFTAVDKTINAKISRVVPSLDPRTRSFGAIVTLDNPKHELRPGMFVEVTLSAGTNQ
ncbi:MAG: efflux RND transporter periplasmic adaptor subunit, partial [Pseudomonadota bacterium]